MRIVCQKCSAAFAIDDKLITAKGIRAQCPRCRNQQLVSKAESSTLPPSPHFPQAGAVSDAPTASFPPLGAELGAGPTGQTMPIDTAKTPAPLSTGPVSPTTKMPRVPTLDTSQTLSPDTGFMLSPPDSKTLPPEGNPFAGFGEPSKTLSLEDDAPPFPMGAPGSQNPSSPGLSPEAFAQTFMSPKSSAPQKPISNVSGITNMPGALAKPLDDFSILAGLPPPPTRSAPAVSAALAAQPAAGGPGVSSSGSGVRGVPPTSYENPSFDMSGLEPARPSPLDAPPSTDEKKALFDFPAKASAPEPEFAFQSDLAAEPQTELAASAPPQTSGIPKCISCGKLLTDAFDQALGTCDVCRAKKKHDRRQLNDEPKKEKKAGDSGPVPAAPRTSPPTSRPSRILSQPPVAQQSSPTVPLIEQRQPEKALTPKTIGIIVGIIALVVGGALLVMFKPWERKRLPQTVRGPTNNTPKVIESLVKQWKTENPELAKMDPKRAISLIAEGEAHLDRDTGQGYRDAEAAFKQAIALTPGDDRAVAGYVLAVTFAHGRDLDPGLAKQIESVLDAAEQRKGDPKLFVAHAHFLLMHDPGNVNDILRLADAGRNSLNPRDKALAAVAIGQASRGETQALEAFAEAVRLDPTLRRTYVAQAKMLAGIGRYKSAVENLEKRLSLDHDQWEASEALARIWVELGEPAKAKRVIEAGQRAAPANARAKLIGAMFAYQHQGEISQAQEALTTLSQDPTLSKREQLDVLTHLSATQRINGDIEAAVATLDRLFTLSADYPPARLQHLLVMLEKGVPSQGRLDLDSIRGKLNDPLLEQTLEGRLLMSQNRYDEALPILTKVVEAEARRVDALFLAGAAAARLKLEGKTWDFCLRRGLKVDPWTWLLSPLTDNYVRPVDLLRSAMGAYASLSPKGEEDPNPVLCEGLVQWYADNPLGADKYFARVAYIDPKNTDGYAYRAFVALKRRDLNGALKGGIRAVDSGKTNGLAWFSLAAAYDALKKEDQSRGAAIKANQFAPHLLGPRTIIASGDAKNNDIAIAKKALTAVLLSDSYYREAKRVLYKHGL